MENLGKSLSSWPDRDLVVAFKGGVPEAYEEMYRRYSDRISHVCRKMLVSPEDAREATQETFLKAYQALPRFNGEYRLGAWLARIATNVCVDHIRRQGRTACITPLTEQHEGLNQDIGPEDIIVRDFPALRTLEQIQPLHARALRLRNFQGLSHKEIADQLGLSPMQVKALLHRARSSFKRAWDSASGWVLAPVAGVRSFMDNGSKDAGIGAHLPLWTQTATPLLAERVAASAIVVAIAFGGAPSAATAPPAAVDVDSLSPQQLAHGDRPLVIQSDAANVAPMKPRAQDSLVADVGSLIEEVKKSAEEPRRERKKDRDGEDDGGGIDPPNPGHASSQVVKTVQRTADEVLPDN